MRNNNPWRALMLVAATASVACPTSGLEITTSLDQRYQTMEGWGAAGGVAGNERMSVPAVRAAYRDLGLNLFRFNLDSRILTPINNDYRIRVPLLGNTFEQNVAKIDFSLRDNIQANAEFAAWLSQNALEPERTKAVASVWTAPHWMKGPTGATVEYLNTGMAHPTPWMLGDHAPWLSPGQGDSIGGRLRTEDATALAEYGEWMAASVEAFERTFGIDLYALSIQNESTFENGFVSMVLDRNASGGRDPGQYAIALDSVRQAWERHGLDTKIKGPHVAMSGQKSPSSPFRLTAQMDYINRVKSFGDGSLLDFIDFYNTNGYVSGDMDAAMLWAGYYNGRDAVPEANWANWSGSITGVKQDGKGIWQSETGGDPTTQWRTNGEDPGAIGVALKIFNAVVHADTSAYIYWQFVDGNLPGSHSLVGDSQLSNPEQSMKYSAFKHFSRYVRPGAERIDATFANGHATTGGANEYDSVRGVNVTSFIHELDETLTYVLINMESSSRTITLNLPEELEFDSFEAYRSTQTERFNQLADLDATSGELTFTMPANSLLTLNGRFLTDPVAGDYNGDGAVDLADYDVWRGAFGSDDVAADGNGDGSVDAADYTVWRDAFEAASAAPVPEPAGGIAMLLGAITPLFGKRHAR